MKNKDISQNPVRNYKKILQFIICIGRYFLEQETKPKTKKYTDASIILSEVNDAILRVPTFVPNFTNVENPECQQHGKIFLRQLRGYKLWALQSESID